MAGVFAVALFALVVASCKSDNPTSSDMVTSRVVTITLKSAQPIAYRARFDLDNSTLVSGASSVNMGPDSVITVTLNALTLPRGSHTARATILASSVVPAAYRMSVGVTENGRPAGTGGSEVTAVLVLGGSIEVTFQF